MYLSRDFVGFYPGIFAPSGFRLLQIQKQNLEIFSSQGVQLRKVSHWPPWLIKIFRKSIPAKIHKRVLFIEILCKSAFYFVLPSQELVGQQDFSVVGDLVENDGAIVGHNGDLDLVNDGPSKIKMFRDGHLSSRSPYYVRAYWADKRSEFLLFLRGRSIKAHPALLVEGNWCWVYNKDESC